MSIFAEWFGGVIFALDFFDDGLTAEAAMGVAIQLRVAVEFPAILQGFGNTAAEAAVVGAGEEAVDFHGVSGGWVLWLQPRAVCVVY